MTKEAFNKKVDDFEEVLQKVASDIASRVLFEKLPPPELLNKTQSYLDRLKDLAENTEEFMLILKPERANTIKSMCKNFAQTLTTFRDILLQNTADPLANSRLAFEQLRKALTDGSDLLYLMREIKENPSPLIDTMLSFKKASETKSQVISIQSSEEVQPLIKYVLGRIDEFRASLLGLEKKVGEMKQIMRELQEESLKIISGKASEDEKEEKPPHNSSFKKENNGDN